MSRITAADRAAIDARRVHRVYEGLARVYDSWFDWALGPGRGIAVESMRVSAGDRVLEIGVGTGLSLPFYSEDIRFTGIDISDAMLAQARERAEQLGRTATDLHLMDATALSFGDGVFDHVLVPYVISVVPEPDRVMSEVRRVVRPGGRVTVVNHFHGENFFQRAFESLFTPLSQWLGFRMDVPLSVVTEAEGFEVLSVRRVNLLGLWRLIELRRVAGSDPEVPSAQ
jgi:phosphatidylethanolamine/phosphatidyl-N-methylethanolamine N-methyltransferase